MSLSLYDRNLSIEEFPHPCHNVIICSTFRA
jgi:hypothetical protein